MTKTHKGLAMHIGWVAASFALANLTVAMFGDGTLDWAHWRFAWVIFIVGQLAACIVVAMAYYNQTAAQESARIEALPQAQPLATPDANGQARVINGAPAPIDVLSKEMEASITNLAKSGLKAALPLLIVVLLFQGCTSAPSPQVSKAIATAKAVQNNPGVQAAEEAAITIGGTLATGSPLFAALAPVAVYGLTAMVNGSNPTAVTGNVTADAPLITQTIAAAIPNSAGKTAAASITNAYVTAMQAPGVPQTPAGANAVIAALASGLNKGAAK
jgi:hypothetical protein